MTHPYPKVNLVPRFVDPRPKTFKSYRPEKDYLKMSIQISKVGHSDLFLIHHTPLPQDELVPRYDDPRPKTRPISTCLSDDPCQIILPLVYWFIRIRFK